jgi:hypothetical protein
MKNTTLKKQIAAWKNDRTVLDNNGQTNEAGFWGFYDWFCKDNSLRIRAERLMPKVIRFIKAHPELDLEKCCVLFKNNCPMVGPTYDDFRICDLETGNVIFTVTPNCSHSGMAEVWGQENNFAQSILTAPTFRELFDQKEVEK